MQVDNNFVAAFKALTGYPPLEWQSRLFNWQAAGDTPAVVTLPTGLGKTSVIPIWLIALAHSARANSSQPALPRRLVYIVNRRTVVDQATDQAKRLLSYVFQSGRRDNLPWAMDDEHILQLGLAHRDRPDDETGPRSGSMPIIHFHEPLPDEQAPAVKEIREALRSLSGDDTKEPRNAPLAVSTLRGELADNGEWKIHPARPAIIIGTIDMIGSKLLLSGYGDGRYGRAHHAGLIGQDALIVHDEAHLSPAFSRLLWTVEHEQRIGERRADHDRCRAITVMELSATTRLDDETERLRREVVAHRCCGGESLGSVFPAPGEEAELFSEPIVAERRGARKRLSFVGAGAAGKKDAAFVVKIAEEAHKHDAAKCRVLIYVQSPITAGAVVGALKAELGLKDAQQGDSDQRIRLLTGTIRGHERDQLAKSDLLKDFRADPKRDAKLEHTKYLVSTSAGEVGADFDADHLVCDLAPLDSMAQRFGRVNRLGVDKDGKRREASATIVTRPIGDKDPLKAQLMKTKACLECLPELRRKPEDGGTGAVRDASPKALSETLLDTGAPHNQDAAEAFTPPPTVLPATDILFDQWSLTSIAWAKGPDGRWRDALPGRPAIEPYLHGVAEWEPPETHVAWRADIALLAAAGGKSEHGEDQPCSRDKLEEVFDVFPLRLAEQLRDRTDRVQKELRTIAERLREVARRRAASPPADNTDLEESNDTGDQDEAGDESAKKGKPIEPNPWVVLIRRGGPAWVHLEDLAPDDSDKLKTEEARRLLAFATVVLPVEAGGLKGGLLNGDEPAPMDVKTLDVAETSVTGQRGRQRVRVRADGTEVALLGGEVDEDMPTKERLTLHTGGDDDEGPPHSAIVAIEYRVARRDAGEPGAPVGMDEHNAAVGRAARRVAAVLRLPDDLVRALELAGKCHDAGKSRVIWQRYARNDDTSRLLAKNKRYRDPRALRGYRHEFGSLHDALANDEIRSLDPETRDLVLHLIAAHHGWARPHFEPRAFDRERPTSDNEAAAVEVMQRFGRLQQRYGRWWLAWLESILRCADAQASAGVAADSPAVSRTSGTIVGAVAQNVGGAT